MSKTEIKKILGLDLGSNSIGWSLLVEKDGIPQEIIDLGCRIFNKAVEEKTPTPKNVNRRNARLARRVTQRRSRRKQRMVNYLVSLDLLPETMRSNPSPETILNALGDPYMLRAKALDHPIEKYELGRIFLHLVQRRGFLSNRKTMLGDLIDDPDIQAVLAETEAVEDLSSERAKEETAFKKEITVLRQTIDENGFRTLGEYLESINSPDCRRNRSRSEKHLRTDRQMYREELELIWKQQVKHHPLLTDEVKHQIEEIIFFQRPLKLRSDRVGKCSLEKEKNRALNARVECQQFRYLQDINNVKYMPPNHQRWISLNQEEREKLVILFESTPAVSYKQLIKTLGLQKSTKFNLEEGGSKKLKGNITACAIRKVYSEWDELGSTKQHALLEDLLTIGKKTVLRKRLTGYWKLTAEQALQLCMLELEPGHSNLSLKAINKLLPYLKQGMLFSDARVAAGYGYELKKTVAAERLGPPPDIPNPIVSKGLHELRRLTNAIIAEYGKPEVVRIEMARDLEMNTKRYQAFLKQQKANTQANDKATEAFREISAKNPHLQLSPYPSFTDKLKYRLWTDQKQRCAYSNININLTTLFTGEVEIDHILPFSQSLDDSYMNKVVCFAHENRKKGQHTPVAAFEGDKAKWEQIKQSLFDWSKGMKSKRNKFFLPDAEVQERDFISSQLNDTRYISKVALDYLKPLGADVTTCKGAITAQVRHWWGLNSLLGENDQKERTDHRHHAIDAAVIAAIDRGFYQKIVRTAKQIENISTTLTMNDLKVNPPWEKFRDNLNEKLASIIVAHEPSRKLSGSLHEETGVGFIEGKGCVYRKTLNPEMTLKQARSIVDPHVCEIVLTHLGQFGDDPKKAFAEGQTVFHKDGVTPIRRVRLLQSKTTRIKLRENKFGVRDRKGRIFKWLAYGNLHHVEIIRDRKNGKVSGKFVTMMEAANRAKGIGMPRQSIVQTDHGHSYEFLMSLHINDLVSAEIERETQYYRVQKLDSGINRVMLRLHTASTLNNRSEELHLSINDRLFKHLNLQKVNVNSIGKELPANDKTDD